MSDGSWDGGTGEISAARDGRLCYDCGEMGPSYMVKGEVWDAAFPDYRAVKRRMHLRYPPGPRYRSRSGPWARTVTLCLACLSRRLGRPLEFEDFLENVEWPLLRLIYEIGLRRRA